MNALPETVARRIAKAIRMLSSPQDGEVVVAAHTLLRLLANEQLDVFWLADRVVSPTNGAGDAEAVTREDLKKVFEDGCAEGIRRAENKRYGNASFVDEDGMPNWSEIALYCQRNIDRIRKPNEQEFINDMAGKTQWGEPTQRQATWLRDIFLRLGGKIT
jgi:hypothetical protein